MKKSSKTTNKKQHTAGSWQASPMARRVVTRKWGNSTGVRIPMSMMKAAKIDVNEELSAIVEDGKIIIEKTMVRKKPSLKDLLAKVKPEHAHVFDDTLIGDEIW